LHAQICRLSGARLMLAVRRRAMATIRDLGECRYLALSQRDERLIAVGWLGKDAPYSKRDVDRAFQAKLEELCKKPWQPFIFAGVHECELCPPRPPASPSKRSSWLRAFSSDRPIRTPAFSANLFVPYQGRVFAAPTGIVHYISSHSYCPPDIFIEAVLACPPMESPEYFDALRANGGPSILARLEARHDHGAV